MRFLNHLPIIHTSKLHHIFNNDRVRVLRSGISLGLTMACFGLYEDSLNQVSSFLTIPYVFLELWSFLAF